MDPRLAKAVGGDRVALSDLLLEHHDTLLRFIERKMSAALKSRLEPEDIFQDTCLAAFKAINSFRPESNQSLIGWLETIAENRVRDAARSSAALKRGGEWDEVPSRFVGDSGSLVSLLDLIASEISTPSLKISREEGLRELRAQLAALPDDYRLAITLKYVRDLSVEETAIRMGRPIDVVRGLLYRARKRLAEGMGGSSLFQFRS
jgi:RNA polymerase sigma-70 factor (ECF subfamily)